MTKISDYPVSFCNLFINVLNTVLSTVLQNFKLNVE